jgi:hypothetical protein
MGTYPAHRRIQVVEKALNPLSVGFRPQPEQTPSSETQYGRDGDLRCYAETSVNQ